MGKDSLEEKIDKVVALVNTLRNELISANKHIKILQIENQALKDRLRDVEWIFEKNQLE